jgi:hypothetical protein
MIIKKFKTIIRVFLYTISLLIYFLANAENEIMSHYVKNGLVYEFGGILYKITGFSKELCKKEKNNNKISNFNNILALGKKLNKNIFIEYFVDFNKYKKNFYSYDANEIMKRTSFAEFNNNATYLDQLFIIPTYNNSPIYRIKQNEIYEEISLSLGSKIGYNFKATTNVNLYGTIGGGYMISSLNYIANGQYSINNTDKELVIRSKSHPSITIFTIATIGAEYKINKDIILGTEYQLKYQIPQDY